MILLLKNVKGRITAADFKLHSDLVSGKHFFYQMKRYIYDHFETVTLDELSDRFYISTTYTQGSRRRGAHDRNG